ncbi:Small integral membrane protein 4-like [Homarus americanus]|uniref:Small integral membrane protein 4-like n=1 Tax=Homarus americanus TaxID=6706 RepID=A0A8J5JVH0_HOMAM|nr:Small integral membrane protein 4-like [Homarus americanus]
MALKGYNRNLHKLLDKWPGKHTLGMYRFLPLFFVLGAALEFSMINWKVGEVNFCEYLRVRIVHTKDDKPGNSLFRNWKRKNYRLKV